MKLVSKIGCQNVKKTINKAKMELTKSRVSLWKFIFKIILVFGFIKNDFELRHWKKIFNKLKVSFTKKLGKNNLNLSIIKKNQTFF